MDSSSASVSATPPQVSWLGDWSRRRGGGGTSLLTGQHTSSIWYYGWTYSCPVQAKSTVSPTGPAAAMAIDSKSGAETVTTHAPPGATTCITSMVFCILDNPRLKVKRSSVILHLIMVEQEITVCPKTSYFSGWHIISCCTVHLWYVVFGDTDNTEQLYYPRRYNYSEH